MRSPATRSPVASHVAPSIDGTRRHGLDWDVQLSKKIRVVEAVPARYGSTRLPGKALALLAGKPMVQHVAERARSARGLDRVVVLTDDERIADVVRAFGGRSSMTQRLRGTDRIAWAARRWQVDAIVNIQGDQPLIDPEGIARVAEHLRAHPEDPIVTLAADALAGDLETPSVVKAVLDARGYALSFSRAPNSVPAAARRGGPTSPPRDLRLPQGGPPAPRRAAAGPTQRLSESLEQLRALSNGIPIRVLTGAAPSLGVDTAEDAAHAERLLIEAASRQGA